MKPVWRWRTKLAPLAATAQRRAGPLVWLGLFDDPEIIPAAEMDSWLAAKCPRIAGALRASARSIRRSPPAAYLAAFDTLQEAIRAGDIYQANLTFPLAGPAKGDPLALYATIRPPPRPDMAGWCSMDRTSCCPSAPNCSSRCAMVQAKVKPMKGTRPRGGSPEQDAALKDELSQSVKDKAENLMIVDLMRNDLSRVAQAGSVRVEHPFAVETYPTLHTMTTTVLAELAQGKSAIDVVHAIFPCGSITGAPKIRAMELIDEVERDARGPYCGGIGRIDANGDARFQCRHPHHPPDTWREPAAQGRAGRGRRDRCR